MTDYLPQEHKDILIANDKQIRKNAELLAACKRGGVPGLEACEEIQREQEQRNAALIAEFVKPVMSP